MSRLDEGYLPPVGFASEPSTDRRRWIGRVLLAILVLFLCWMLVTRVINTPDEQPSTGTTEGPLPDPF